MQLPASEPQHQPGAQPPAIVHAATREDVQWSRPIFKAPPLVLHPQAFDAKIFAQDIRRIGLNTR